jgi:Mrp family chromosome partitioning ATPase
MAHLRRYWWLVLAVALLSVGGAALSARDSSTTFTGRSSLIVSSNNRSPDQDAVLVQGYVTYFNDPAYQSRLLATADVGADVTVSAHAAAASPILLIDATTGDPRSAQIDAATLASTFRADINRVREREIAAEIVSLQRQIKETLAPGAQVAGGVSVETAITQLQNQILQLKADRVDILQVLQLHGGVSQHSPPLATNLLLALVGGLVLGGLAALAVGRLSNRLHTSLDLSERVGIETLVELPSEGTDEVEWQRALRVRQLATIVRARLGSPSVVAVTEPTPGIGAATVAMALARQWADEGRSSLIVRAAGSTSAVASSGPHDQQQPEPGDLFPGSLGATWNSWIVTSPVQGMWVLQQPAQQPGGPQELTGDAIHDLLTHAATSETLVVLETSPVTRSASALDLCATAGLTLLAIEMPATRVAEIAEGASLLEQSNAGLLGAVLLPTKARSRRRRHGHRREDAGSAQRGPDLTRHDPAHGSTARPGARPGGDDEPIEDADSTLHERVGRGDS